MSRPRSRVRAKGDFAPLSQQVRSRPDIQPFRDGGWEGDMADNDQFVILEWVRHLQESASFNHAIEEHLEVARVVDRIYGEVPGNPS